MNKILAVICGRARTRGLREPCFLVLLHLLESGGGFFTGEVLFIAVGAKAVHSALLRPGAAQVSEPMLQPVHTFVYVCFPSVNMDAYFLGKCSSAFPVLLVLYY